MGPGTGVNPASFLTEIGELDRQVPHLDVKRRIHIAERAHVIMPYHRILDGAQERSRGDLVQGTTGRGNGPLYADKYARSGIQIADLFESDYLQRWLQNTIPEKSSHLARLGSEPLDLDATLELCRGWAEQLAPYVVDSFELVQNALAEKQNVLLEGQLGIMRDVDWGHYPYVTSSSADRRWRHHRRRHSPQPDWQGDRGGQRRSLRRSARALSPTELSGPQGERLRIEGGEFGVSTGRPRRVGWMGRGWRSAMRRPSTASPIWH